jgi:hypothetical protein
MGGQHGRRFMKRPESMTEQERLIQEIKERLRNTPKAGMIDSLAYATRLSQDYSISVDEIRKIVVKKADAAGVTHV